MEEKPKISGIKELFKGSFEIYKVAWKNSLILALLVALVSLVSTYFINGTLVPQTQIDAERIASPVFWLGVLVAVALTLPLTLALNKVIFGTGEGTTETIGEAVTYGFKNFFSYLFIGLMAGLVVVVGLILLLIPGIYLIILFSLISAVYIVEGQRGIAVLKRSSALVKGYFWAVFGRIIVLSLATSFLVALFFGNSPIISNLVTAFVAPFSAAYTYLIYKNLKTIKVA